MKDIENITELMADIGQRAKAAAAELGSASAERKHAALIAAAEAVWSARAEIMAANAKDLDYGRDKGLSEAMMDRLMLDEDRIQGMVDDCAVLPRRPTRWARFWPNGINLRVCISNGSARHWA